MKDTLYGDMCIYDICLTSSQKEKCFGQIYGKIGTHI